MTEEWAAPTPTFKAEEALVGLKRQLRDLRPLAERGQRFELRGVAVIELGVADAGIVARVAQRPTSNTIWQDRSLLSAADVRRFIDDMRRLLRRWEGEE